MPSKSRKQARFMAAAAHNPEFAARNHIPQSVAREFNQADKGGGLLSKAMKHKRKKKHRRQHNKTDSWRITYG